MSEADLKVSQADKPRARSNKFKKSLKRRSHEITRDHPRPMEVEIAFNKNSTDPAKVSKASKKLNLKSLAVLRQKTQRIKKNGFESGKSGEEEVVPISKGEKGVFDNSIKISEEEKSSAEKNGVEVRFSSVFKSNRQLKMVWSYPKRVFSRTRPKISRKTQFLR